MIFLLKIFVPKGFRGITLFPFIFLKYPEDKENSIIINHEKIHLQQQVETLIVLFYLWYTIEYFIRFIQYKDKKRAYKNISFEREAYLNDKNLEYLKSRKFWSFIKYIKLKKM